ncbi:Pcl9p [Saccharomyces paradoxus]|uniref:Pcl9p n=1 Tax=Saccharomyces paradoxus TaxID=27291 RepID=A0A8B8UMW1_SACPA|nr:Pcl9 [Saccharomyces paradoxus]QHS72065.1 Pcl9 [Saccharomyces paradoxus]
MISDYDALLQFNKRPVSQEMIQFLATSTASIIQIRQNNNSVHGCQPPDLPTFIKNVVIQSNVQTPTLMATSVYLNKLKSVIPKNVYGIETTRHRIFLGCLILAAKTLNDSSPWNKHWTTYTEGLLRVREVNTIERELLEYFNWDVRITTPDLIKSLSYFLGPIKEQLFLQRRQELLLFNAPSPGQLKEYINHRRPISHSRSSSAISVPSLTSMTTVSTTDSRSSVLAKYQPPLPLVEFDNYNKENHVPPRNNDDMYNNFRAQEYVHPINHVDVTPRNSPITSHKPTVHQRLNFTRRGWSSFFKQ